MTRIALVMVAAALLCGSGYAEEVSLPATPTTTQVFPAVEAPGPHGWTLSGLAVEAAFACNPCPRPCALSKSPCRLSPTGLTASLVPNTLPHAGALLTTLSASPTRVTLRTNDLTALRWLQVTRQPTGPGLRR
ncbi:hypothetical protein LLH03_02825 [bacterium]|nr:hypothetical protein [bacterium]